MMMMVILIIRTLLTRRHLSVAIVSMLIMITMMEMMLMMMIMIMIMMVTMMMDHQSFRGRGDHLCHALLRWRSNIQLKPLSGTQFVARSIELPLNCSTLCLRRSIVMYIHIVIGIVVAAVMVIVILFALASVMVSTVSNRCLIVC
jgi:hypothetical protein